MLKDQVIVSYVCVCVSAPVPKNAPLSLFVSLKELVRVSSFVSQKQSHSHFSGIVLLSLKVQELFLNARMENRYSSRKWACKQISLLLDVVMLANLQDSKLVSDAQTALLGYRNHLHA